MKSDEVDTMSTQPKLSLFDELKRGDGVRVAFGAKASQLAIVHDRTRAGNVRVWKFSAKRKCWKGPIRIYPGEVMNRAREYEFADKPPLPAAYRDGALK